MTTLVRLGLVVGVGLLVVVGERAGWASLQAVLMGGAVAIACSSAYRFVTLALFTMGWRSLLPAGE